VIRTCTLALFLGMFAAAAWSAEPLGRFFFTPQQRAELDAARGKRSPAPPRPAPVVEPATDSDAQAGAPRPPQVITYSGMVRRSDGRSVLWLNEQPMDAKEALARLPLAGRVRPDGAVSLQDPHSGRTIDLKVGQSIELDSGGVTEGRRARHTPPGRGAAAPDATPAPPAGSSGDAPR
jgi:hypothetical protein